MVDRTPHQNPSVASSLPEDPAPVKPTAAEPSVPANSQAQNAPRVQEEVLEYGLPQSSQVAGSYNTPSGSAPARPVDDSSEVIAPLVFSLIALFMAFVPGLAAIFAIIALVLVHKAPKDIAYKSRLLVARVCAIVSLFVNALVIALIVVAGAFFANSTTIYEHVLGNPYEVGESGFEGKYHPENAQEQEIYDGAVKALDEILHPDNGMKTKIVNMLNSWHLIIDGTQLNKSLGIDWMPWIDYCQYETEIHITNIYVYPNNPNRASVYLRIDACNRDELGAYLERAFTEVKRGNAKALPTPSNIKDIVDQALQQVDKHLGDSTEVHFICEMEKQNGTWKIMDTEIAPLIETIY